MGSESLHPVLRVADLSIEFRTEEGLLRAVDQVSFEVWPNETVGLVGSPGVAKPSWDCLF